MGKGQPRCIVGMSYGAAVEDSVQVLETLSTELPFDPEVPLHGVSSKELKASPWTSISAPCSRKRYSQRWNANSWSDKGFALFLGVVCGPAATNIWDPGSWTPLTIYWSKSICFSLFPCFKKFCQVILMYLISWEPLIWWSRSEASTLGCILSPENVKKKKKKSFWKIFTH